MVSAGVVARSLRWDDAGCDAAMRDLAEASSIVGRNKGRFVL